MNIDSAYPSNYIKASDLNGQAVAVVIADVKIEEVGRSKDPKPVVYFRGKKKGLVLNRTNAKKIAEITGSRDTEDWSGAQIAIYPTETEFGGESVECVRVKAVRGGGMSQPSAPAPKPEPAPPSPDLIDDDIPF